MAQKFFSDVSLESSSNLTLVDGVLTVNDGNNYVKISEGSNSIGQIELKDSSSVFLQGWGNDFRVAVNGTYNNHALVINSSKHATFYGNIILGGGNNKYIEYSGTGKLINTEVSSWTSGQQEHNILYAGWTSGTGDYLSFKVPGNSTSAHGNLIIGDITEPDTCKSPAELTLK